MTLTIELSPELEQRLEAEVRRCGTSADRLAVRLLDRHLPMQNHAARTPDDERRTRLATLLDQELTASIGTEVREISDLALNLENVRTRLAEIPGSLSALCISERHR